MLKGSSCCCVDSCFTQIYKKCQAKKSNEKAKTEKLVIQLCSSKDFNGLSYFGEGWGKSYNFLKSFLNAMNKKPEDN